MAIPRTVLLTGATGLVGGRLVPTLLDEGRAVRAVTRSPDSARERSDPRVHPVGWDGRSLAPGALEGVDAIVHLAGEPVFQVPLTRARRARIRDSRVLSTRSLVSALAARPSHARPAVLVCASAVGFYGDRGDAVLDEDAAPGDGFLADVCREWEAEAARAQDAGVRVVSVRIGLVLAEEGGALPLMAWPFKLGVGGRLGSGRQWVPWVHADDLVGLLRLAMDRASLSGAVNGVAPEPVRNAELTRALASCLNRPALLPVPAFAVRLALGELAGELLGSRRVVPRRAEEAGYRWRHPRIDEALAAELG